jgi:hypothetical protein
MGPHIGDTEQVVNDHLLESTAAVMIETLLQGTLNGIAILQERTPLTIPTSS